GRTFLRHQEMILKKTEFKKFNSYYKKILMKEVELLTVSQLKPRLIFMSLIDFLQTNKIQIPSYNTLAEIITQSLKIFERKLVQTIKDSLTEKETKLIDELFEKENSESATGPYSLTAMKTHSHSVRAGKIKENIADYKYLEKLFMVIFFVLGKIKLTPNIIKYYADVVFRSQVFQISRRDENKYLYLIAFIINNFYELNDMLVLKVNKAVQQSKNSGEKEKKELIFENRISVTEIMKKVASGLISKKHTVALIKRIILDSTLSPEEKIESVMEILNKDDESKDRIDNDLVLVNEEISRVSDDADYYDSLEAKSVKLQNKISDIIKHLIFDEKYSNEDLINTINYFKDKNGRISKNAPLILFEDKEQKILFYNNGKIRISLYKILLFIKISHGIKSGTLNLLYSYEYRAFAHYLISQSLWENNRKEYLERSGLSKFKSWDNIKENLKKTLERQYNITNRNIEKKVNQYVKINEDGKIILTRYKTEETSDETLELFPQNKYISIYEVITTVNEMTDFIDSFEHIGHKYGRDIPDQTTIIAGILGYGCNIGIHKIAKLSREINSNKLNNAVKMRFLLDNIYNANNKVLSLIGKFEVSKLFKKRSSKTHTASDGQKFLSTVDSVYANKSFKYFGMNDGLVINSFIDEINRLFYSTVISPSEREAPYTIDGLLHNEVVQSEIHSTDTHGYNEIIFAVTHLLGISFAPRIANFKKQYLYSFDPVSDVKKLGYKIVPNRKINIKLIEDNWDEILRFIATLKTKEVTASQLFKRLSSYSREHLLYKALKEFGKIIKTIFLLQYIDDVDLRRQIQKMLNRIESSNKLGKAVFHGSNKEFKYAGKNDQLVADACKRLIENCIICWNYAYLTQLISDEISEEQRKVLINIIKNKSVVAWEHINLSGMYDFSKNAISNEYNFKREQLLNIVI
ncbi:MAG: Tn3 family transposase, partial [Candidatus Cloacimonadota bacterium]|nr:Tn3 family transposase [Candidatus Cloacimonadota bacterium]